MYLFIRMQVIIYPCRLLHISPAPCIPINPYAGYYISTCIPAYLSIRAGYYISMCAGVGYYISMCAYLAIALHPAVAVSLHPAVSLLSMFHVKHFRLFPCIPILSMQVIIIRMCVII